MVKITLLLPFVKKKRISIEISFDPFLWSNFVSVQKKEAKPVV